MDPTNTVMMSNADSSGGGLRAGPAFLPSVALPTASVNRQIAKAANPSATAQSSAQGVLLDVGERGALVGFMVAVSKGDLDRQPPDDEIRRPAPPARLEQARLEPAPTWARYERRVAPRQSETMDSCLRDGDGPRASGVVSYPRLSESRGLTKRSC
jgi:hypothetical protein